MEIIINGLILKPYDENYFISDKGDVWSKRMKLFLKHEITLDGHHRVRLYGNKKRMIHRMVYEVWVGKIPNGLQINHRDDNKDNNHFSNLYAGTQKENIADCVRNGNRKGNIDHITIFDKEANQILTFSPMKDFIVYCGHPSKNGSVKKFFNKNWFKKRYDVLDYGKGCID